MISKIFRDTDQTGLDSPETTTAQIAELAYLLWQERGCPVGSPDEDWYEAERQLRSKRQAHSNFARPLSSMRTGS